MSIIETVSRAALITFVSIAAAGCAPFPASGIPSEQKVAWRFDQLDRVGGAPVRVQGQPEVVGAGPARAVRFDGIDDALFIGQHPLAGAATFTIEAIFRPDGGAFEQRWLHLAEADPAAPAGTYPPVKPNGPRFLFEIRVVAAGWYLDAFTAGPGYSQALMVPAKLHPIGRWYHVAQAYDGRTYRSYVNGMLQAEAPLLFVPQGAGYASVGTRINRRSYFSGAVHTVRFTRRALGPSQFMKIPAALEP